MVMENLAYGPLPEPSDPSHLLLHRAHSNPLRPQPLQPIRNPREYHIPPRPTQALYAPSKAPQQFIGVYNAGDMGHGQAYFKEFVDDPDRVYLPGHSAFHTLPSLQMPQPQLGFRPLESCQLAYPHVLRQTVPKVDEDTALPTPALLPGNVDASQYEAVSYPEWINASTEYQSLSPSSLKSSLDSPATPGDWKPDHSLAKEAFTSMQFNARPCGSTSTAPTAITCHGFPPLPPGSRFDGGFDRPLGLPAIGEHYLRQPRICTADPQNLSLPGSCFSSDNGTTSADIPSSQGYESDQEEDDQDLRRQQDDLLLRMREEGFKYGDIKRCGRFREAESTLRGRYRSLTKDRAERLRNPQWQARDVVLLRQAVRRYTNGNISKLKTKHGGKKVPWKKIGEWIKDHGGSYLFAPATCAKKWDSIKRFAPDSPSAAPE